MWLVIVLASLPLQSLLDPRLSELWNDFVLTPANVLMISNGYFWLVMRTYVRSFPLSQTSLDAGPIFGICILMTLARIPVRQIAKVNLVVLSAVAPLALQYVLIAVEHGTPLK